MSGLIVPRRGLAWRCAARRGVAPLGKSWHVPAGLGSTRLGRSGLGVAPLRHGLARPGGARPGAARPGMAPHSWAGRGSPDQGSSRRGSVRQVKVRHDEVRPVVAPLWLVPAWPDRRGGACLGEMRLGMARLPESWRCVSRQGRAGRCWARPGCATLPKGTSRLGAARHGGVRQGSRHGRARRGSPKARLA